MHECTNRGFFLLVGIHICAYEYVHAYVYVYVNVMMMWCVISVTILYALTHN